MRQRADGHARQLVPAQRRVRRARTARCSSPTGTIRASAATTSRKSIAGRIFRVAPPGTKYTLPKYDFTTPAGCMEALKNPDLERAVPGVHGAGAIRATRPHQAAARSCLEQTDDPRCKAPACVCGAGEAAKARPKKSVEMAHGRSRTPDPICASSAIRLAREHGIGRGQARRRCARIQLPKSAASWPSPAAQQVARRRRPVGRAGRCSTTARTAGISKPSASPPTSSGTPTSTPTSPRPANPGTPRRPRHPLAQPGQENARAAGQDHQRPRHQGRRPAALLPGARFPQRPGEGSGAEELAGVGASEIGEPIMPLLDHFHPPLSTQRHWESFHTTWAGGDCRCAE